MERERDQKRDREKIFSPNMLDSIASSLASGGGASGRNFSQSQSSSGPSTRSASASASNQSSKPPSTKPMVLHMSMFGSASGNTNTSGGGSTSTSAPPPPPPPQPHIGDKDKLVDASVLDTFNAADTLAGEMSPTPNTSSDLDQGGGDGDVGLAEMLISPSVSGASSLYAAGEQTGLTSWHASECRSEAGTSTISRTHSAGHSRKRSTSENYGHLGSGGSLRRFLTLSLSVSA